MRALAIIIAVAGAAGCEKKFNEEYCIKHGDDPAYAQYCQADGNTIDAKIPDGPPGTFRITGVVNGLVGMVVLQNNGGDDKMVVSDNGQGVPFFFPTTQLPGTTYDVTVLSKPDPLTCTVANGMGTVMNDDVRDINVTCAGDLGVACGGTFCTTGQGCCYDVQMCATACVTKIMHCDDTADCMGTGVCCGLRNNGGQILGSACKSDVAACMATNANDEILCDPTPSANDTVCGAMQCLSSNNFATYHSCQ